MSDPQKLSERLSKSFKNGDFHKNVGFSNKKSCKMLQKKLFWGSKWSQKYTLYDPRCPQTFFKNFGVEASKFLLSGKNGAPKSVDRV